MSASFADARSGTITSSIASDRRPGFPAAIGDAAAKPGLGDNAHSAPALQAKCHRPVSRPAIDVAMFPLTVGCRRTDATSNVKQAASNATSLSRNCSTSVDTIGKPVALFSVMPGVLKTNDVVSTNVNDAIAAPIADATGIADPAVNIAAVSSSIVPMILASPITPNTFNQLMKGLCEISGAIESAAYGVNF